MEKTINIKYIVVLFFLIVFASCKKSMDLEKDEIIKWNDNESNKLSKTLGNEQIEFKATFCLPDYIISKEVKGDRVFEKNYLTRKQDFKGLEYFKIRIKRKNSNQEVLLYNLNNEDEYLERVNYLSYGFDENICLVRNDFKDTLYPSLYHFERTYGIVPYADILVSFKEDTLIKSNNYKLLINDVVFGTGIMVFDFDKKNIKNAPKLKLY